MIKKYIYRLILIAPSTVKNIYFKNIKKYKIGKGVIFKKKSWIYGKDVIVEDNVLIGENSTINGNIIHIGKRSVLDNDVKIIAAKSIQIGSDCYCGKFVTIAGGQTRHSQLILGNRVKIFENTFINTSRKVTIEDDVGIGGRCLIFTHGTWQNTYKGYPYKFGDVTIRKNAWLPWQVFVMPGIEIGENATIGSCSVILKDIPSNCFAGGFPAKVLKEKGAHVKNNDKTKHSVLSEILKEVTLDYNFFNNENYVFNKENMSISLNGKNVVQLNNTSKRGALSSETLLLYDKQEDLNYPNQINLNNNMAVIGNTSVFSHALIDMLSNYGIRIQRVNKNV